MAQAPVHMTQSIQAERRRLLIDATMSAIADHGLSNLTLAKVAGLAGLTAGTVNFHFTSKEALLLETLRYVADEFSARVAAALEHAGEDPGERLLAMVDVSFEASLTSPSRIAVWYAFIAETRAREDYLKICGARDREYYATIFQLCRSLVEQAGKTDVLDAQSVAYGLAGLIDQLWQDLLFEGDDYDREAARRQCRAYLASVFPWRFRMPQRPSEPTAPAEQALAPLEQDGMVYTLPAWIYNSEEFFTLERSELFMSAWQLVCHASDVAGPGSYVTFEFFNERAFVVRGADGALRAFYNVCPHRAHSLVRGQSGSCRGRVTCPYHGWTFDLQGRRVGLAAPESFREHPRSDFGLKPLELEVYRGFVFIRFRGGGPGVAEQFAPVAAEFAAYRTEDMVYTEGDRPDGEFWTEIIDVDWKNAVENYLEDYHFPNGHRGLSALMEVEYDRDPLTGALARLSHRMREVPLRNWSVERYHRLLPDQAHLPEAMRRRWTYYALYPNTFFDMFPEQMDFMQMLPLAPGKMMLRGRTYCLPDDSRAARAARYLGTRINTRVQDEDNDLTSEVQKGLGTSGYQCGILSDKEKLVRHFQDWVRGRLPAARLAAPPPAGTLARRNEELKAH